MSANPERYAWVVLTRYEELGLSTDAKIYMAGGPSTSTLTAYRNARDHGAALSTPRDDTFGKVDISCHWRPGSARKVWNGGDPIEAVGGDGQDGAYVAAPGDRTEHEVSNADLLREMRAMREAIERLANRD